MLTITPRAAYWITLDHTGPERMVVRIRQRDDPRWHVFSARRVELPITFAELLAENDRPLSSPLPTTVGRDGND
jgi:hypothetical protein